MRHLLLPAFCVLLLSGCATTIDYNKNLTVAKPCCADFKAIKYKPLQYNKPLQMKLGGESGQVRVFPEGKSFFFPIKLPEFDGAYEIQIQSQQVGNQVFLPRILMLNDKHQVAKKIPSAKFKFENGTASHKFFLNKDFGYQYMVLYTAPADVGKESIELRNTSSTTPIYAGPYVFYYTNGSEAKVTIKSAEGGSLKVTALKYKPRIIGE